MPQAICAASMAMVPVSRAASPGSGCDAQPAFTAGGGLNSGVINYINNFSDAAYKSLDPVSELFYESIRYFKHLGPTPEYSAGLTTGQMGCFQIVNSWSDPQQYLRVHIANLRRKIEQDAVRPRLILTEPGVGYRLELPR